MKKTSKIIAILITIALIVGTMPIIALADEGDVMSITLGGRSVTGFDPEGQAVAAITGVPVTIPATAATGLATRLVITEEDDGGDADAFTGTAFFWEAEEDEPVTTATEIQALPVFGTQEIVTGDRIYIETFHDTYIRLDITVAAANNGTIEGGNTVEDMLITMIIPTNLDFVLNPLEVGDVIDGSQITATDYVFANKTGFPVLVSLDIEAELHASVALVDQGSVFAGSAKEIFFAAIGATSATGPIAFVDGSGGTFAYNAKANGTLIPFAGATPTATIEFSLGAATPVGTPTALAAANAGVASFQFFAELNELATWNDNDIKVSGAYTLRGMRPSTYAATSTTGLNVVVDSEFDLVFTSPSTLTWTGTRASLLARQADEEDVTFRVLFVSKPEITLVKNFVTNGIWAEGTTYTYDEDTGIFELVGLPPGASTNPIPTVVIDTDQGVFMIRYNYTD